MASQFKDDKNMEVAVSNILGHENVEHLIQILNTEGMNFSINEHSVGDTLIEKHTNKIM